MCETQIFDFLVKGGEACLCGRGGTEETSEPVGWAHLGTRGVRRLVLGTQERSFL